MDSPEIIVQLLSWKLARGRELLASALRRSVLLAARHGQFTAEELRRYEQDMEHALAEALERFDAPPA